MKKMGLIWFVVYLIFGLYFINYGLKFFTIPVSVDGYNDWIIFVGGLLILWGGINHYRAAKKAIGGFY